MYTFNMLRFFVLTARRSDLSDGSAIDSIDSFFVAHRMLVIGVSNVHTGKKISNQNHRVLSCIGTATGHYSFSSRM